MKPDSDFREFQVLRARSFARRKARGLQDDVVKANDVNMDVDENLEPYGIIGAMRLLKQTP